MSRLEALLDSIAVLNDFSNPESEAYKLRNPLMLKVYSLFQLKPQNEEGYRVFTSFIGGYRAGLADLTVKCEGASRAKVKRDSPLRELLAAYGWKDDQVIQMVVKHLQIALDDKTISAKTPAFWFVQPEYPTSCPVLQ